MVSKLCYGSSLNVDSAECWNRWILNFYVHTVFSLEYIIVYAYDYPTLAWPMRGMWWPVTSVTLSVCVHTLKGKRLELSTPNLVLHILYGSRSVCIKSGGQKIKGQGHMVTKTVTVAWLLVTAVAVVLLGLLSAWVCTSYDCLGFLLINTFIVDHDKVQSLFMLLSIYLHSETVTCAIHVNMQWHWISFTKLSVLIILTISRVGGSRTNPAMACTDHYSAYHGYFDCVMQAINVSGWIY